MNVNKNLGYFTWKTYKLDLTTSFSFFLAQLFDNCSMLISSATGAVRRILKYNAIATKAILSPVLFPIRVIHKLTHSIFVFSYFLVYVFYPPPNQEDFAERRTFISRFLHFFHLDESFYPSFNNETVNQTLTNTSNIDFGIRAVLLKHLSTIMSSTIVFFCGDIILESFYGSFLKDFIFSVMHPPMVVYGPGLIPVYSTPEADYVISFGDYGDRETLFYSNNEYTRSIVEGLHEKRSSSKPLAFFPRMLGIEDTLRLFDFYENDGFLQKFLPKLLTLYVLTSKTANFTLV